MQKYIPHELDEKTSNTYAIPLTFKNAQSFIKKANSVQSQDDTIKTSYETCKNVQLHGHNHYLDCFGPP